MSEEVYLRTTLCGGTMQRMQRVHSEVSLQDRMIRKYLA